MKHCHDRTGFAPIAVALALAAAPAGLAAEADDVPLHRLPFLDSAASNTVFRLSLADCVACTLRTNAEIRVRKMDVRLREKDVDAAEAAFEPSFSAAVSRRDTTTSVPLPSNTYSSAVSRATDYSVGLSGRLPMGTQWKVEVAAEQQDNDPAQSAVDPFWSVEPKVTVTQPLLRGMGTTVNRAEIRVARNRATMAFHGLRETAMDAVSRALIAYHAYHYGQEAQAIAETSLRRAQDLLEVNKARYAKGLISSVDLLETEAVASDRVKALLASESAVRKAEDLLKLVTNLVDDEKLWNARIELTDRPKVVVRNADLTASLRNAFRLRADYLTKTTDLKNRKILIQVAENARLPSLDLVGSFGLNGLGAEYQDAVRDVDWSHDDWLVGLKLTIPWGGAERAREQQRKMELAQALIELKRLEQTIILDVRDRVREVGIQFRQVEASRLALEKETKNYEAQRERYAAGQVSTHDMLEYQTRLTVAESDFLRAVVDYQTAVVNLDKAEGMTLARNNVVLEE